jgi:hypothetical protein
MLYKKHYNNSNNSPKNIKNFRRRMSQSIDILISNIGQVKNKIIYLQ